jgi:hypothetical protein
MEFVVSKRGKTMLIFDRFKYYNIKINSAQNNIKKKSKKQKKILNHLITTGDKITKKIPMKLVGTLLSKLFPLIIRFFKT